MITFDLPLPNGALGRYHRVVRFEMTTEGSSRAILNSYSDDTLDFIAWQDEYPLTVPTSGITTLHDVELVLTQPGGPLDGGLFVSAGTTLTAEQERKWVEVKLERDRRTTGTMSVDGRVFQIDGRSLQRMRNTLEVLTEGDTIEWTLADNSTETLTRDDIERTLYCTTLFINAAHAVSQDVRASIYSEDATIESVAEIAPETLPWPVPCDDAENTPEAPEEPETPSESPPEDNSGPEETPTP